MILRAFSLVALLGIALAGCATKRADPPLFEYESADMALRAALAHAHGVNGRLMFTSNTGSMEPLIHGGDLLVVEPVAFDALYVGQVIIYYAEWQPSDAPPVCHRIVAKDKLGLVMAGDHNAHSEPHYRVTERTYVGLVAGIYRVSQ